MLAENFPRSVFHLSQCFYEIKRFFNRHPGFRFTLPFCLDYSQCSTIGIVELHKSVPMRIRQPNGNISGISFYYTHIHILLWL